MKVDLYRGRYTATDGLLSATGDDREHAVAQLNIARSKAGQPAAHDHGGTVTYMTV